MCTISAQTLLTYSKRNYVFYKKKQQLFQYRPVSYGCAKEVFWSTGAKDFGLVPIVAPINWTSLKSAAVTAKTNWLWITCLVCFPTLKLWDLFFSHCLSDWTIVIKSSFKAYRKAQSQLKIKIIYYWVYYYEKSIKVENCHLL